MKTKHWMPALIVLVLVAAFILAGCGTKTTTQTATAPAVTTTATTTATATATTTATATATVTSTASTTTSAASGQPKYGGKLIVAEGIFYGKPLGWPPEAGFDSSVWMQIALETLLWEDISGKFTGLLATDWKVDYNAPSVTFTIRQGVKFHDGSDLNAEVVAWNLQNMIPSKFPSVVTWKSVDVLDAYTVRVNLISWTNTALENFSTGGRAFIVSRTAYDQNGVEWMKQNMVGTGPFKQESIQPGVKVVYTRNPDYWRKDARGNQLPYLDGVEYWGITDPMTQIASMKNGTIMGMATAADKNLYDLQKEGFTAVVQTIGVGAYFPDSSHASSPLSQQAVREAVEYALDKEAISEALGYGFWKPAYQFAPEVSTAFDSGLPGRQYDPDKARQLLTDAGYPGGIDITIYGTIDNKDILTAMQGQLSEVNIRAKIEIADSAKFQEYGLSGWNDGFLYGAPGGVSNWINGISSFMNPDSSYYAACLRTDEFRDLFTAAMYSNEKDPVKEKAVVDYIYNTAMVLPLENKVRGWVTAPYVKDGGFFSNAAAFYWTPGLAWLDQ